MAILKTQNKIRHTDTLTYLDFTLDNDSPRKISIYNQEELSIVLEKTNINELFLLAQIFRAVQAELHCVTSIHMKEEKGVGRGPV